MGFFDIFKGKNLVETDLYSGDTPACPQCGTPLTKKYVYSEMYCENCSYGLEDEESEDDDDDDGESLSVYDAAQMWLSSGKDEDYTFGYSIKELEDASK